jgi:hypothetical protein
MNRFALDSSLNAAVAALVLVVCSAPMNAVAAVSALEAGGYVKELLSRMDTSPPGSDSTVGKWQSTLQVRVDLHFYPAESFTAGLGSRHLLTVRRNIGGETSYADQINPAGDYYLDLEASSAGGNSVLTSAVDRLWVDWTCRRLEVTAGRQRIAWGTCLVWNPTDLFNPYSVLDFDYEEKPGSDALRIEVYTGAVSKVELAGGPGRKSEDVTYGAHYLASLWGYDVSIVGGWEKRVWRWGAGWSGQMMGAGLRGEVLYSKPGATIVPDASARPGPPYSDGAAKAVGDFWTLALSCDYTFRSSFYVVSEFLYDGLGTRGDAGDRWSNLAVTGELSPARYSVFQEFAYNLTPLLRAEAFAILNPDDRSWSSVSSLAYSIATDWELRLFALPSGGRAGTEFGGMPSQVALRMRYDF